MNKLVVAFVMWFFVGCLLSGVMEGGGGINATVLTANHTDVVTTLTVASTEGFLKKGYVIVENERIAYTNKTATTFTGCARSWDNTTASTHATGTRVYSPEASVINYALGFDIAATGTTAGAMYIPVVLYNFFFVTLPRIIMWDYSWLRSSEWLVMFRYALMILSIGFVVYIAYMIASFLAGILQGIFVRGT